MLRLVTSNYFPIKSSTATSVKPFCTHKPHLVIVLRTLTPTLNLLGMWTWRAVEGYKLVGGWGCFIGSLPVKIIKPAGYLLSSHYDYYTTNHDRNLVKDYFKKGSPMCSAFWSVLPLLYLVPPSKSHTDTHFPLTHVPMKRNRKQANPKFLSAFLQTLTLHFLRKSTRLNWKTWSLITLGQPCPHCPHSEAIRAIKYHQSIQRYTKTCIELIKWKSTFKIIVLTIKIVIWRRCLFRKKKTTMKSRMMVKNCCR